MARRQRRANSLTSKRALAETENCTAQVFRRGVHGLAGKENSGRLNYKPVARQVRSRSSGISLAPTIDRLSAAKGAVIERGGHSRPAVIERLMVRQRIVGEAIPVDFRNGNTCRSCRAIWINAARSFLLPRPSQAIGTYAQRAGVNFVGSSIDEAVKGSD
jgi:hypothetical protein